MSQIGPDDPCDCGQPAARHEATEDGGLGACRDIDCTCTRFAPPGQREAIGALVGAALVLIVLLSRGSWIDGYHRDRELLEPAAGRWGAGRMAD